MMAGKRHRKTDSSTTKSAPRKPHRALTQEQHLANVRYLTKSGKRPDPSNVRSVARQASELRRREALERNYTRKVTPRQRDQLRERGFHVSKRGVVIDGPRDSRRKPIAGAKMNVLKDGTVKWTVGQRRDFVVGLSSKDKKAFAKDPELFTKEILRRLRETNPTLKKIRPARIQKRLQWGAFQATKDFSPQHFTKQYFSMIAPEERTRGGKEKRLDKLTGLHFVIHIPKPSKARKRKRGKRGRKHR
jgi:hypothetical protein